MIFEILKNPMYSYLFILTLVIFLVIFLWRKLTILESNFYILEKRVNLIKESKYQSKNVGDTAGLADVKKPRAVFENMTDKKLERSNMVMNEIFGNYGNLTNSCIKEDVTITFDTEKIIDELDITKIIEDEVDNINIIEELHTEAVIDEPTISYDIKEENTDFENTSNASEFVFNADEKYTQKKLSKLNMDKLKTICEKMNISTEGNKSQLISRILE
jgi:hypothetical protein